MSTYLEANPEYGRWVREIAERAARAPHHGEDVLGLVLRDERLVRDGAWAEFGVASGTSLRRMARLRGEARVWGFDTFTGLPEDWDNRGSPHKKGHFAQEHIPNVPGAHIVSGLFQDVLPHWEPLDPLTLVHVDCDLYSASKCVLDYVGPRLAAGAIVVFDEIFEYPGHEEHELRALYEWTCDNELVWEFLYVGGERAAIGGIRRG